MGPWAPYWAELLKKRGHVGPLWGGIAPKSATWAPLGPLWAGIAPESLHMGRNCSQKAPHGPLGPLWDGFGSKPSRATAAFLAGAFFSSRTPLFGIFGPKVVQKKIEIKGARPIWLDPQRNSASNPASDVQTGGMATHFKPNWCHFGSLGVPAPASTPLPGGLTPVCQGGRVGS